VRGERGGPSGISQPTKGGKRKEVNAGKNRNRNELGEDAFQQIQEALFPGTIREGQR